MDILILCWEVLHATFFSRTRQMQLRKIKRVMEEPASISVRIGSKQGFFMTETSISSSTEPVPIDYASPQQQVVYASFGQRLGAWLIDTLVLGLLRLGVAVGLGAVFALFGDPDYWPEWLQGTVGLFVVMLMIVCGWLYHAIPESSVKQATIGKRAMGIQVADIEEGRATFIQTSARYFLRISSSLTLGVGFLMILFTKRCQALHDLCANCVVIDEHERS